MKHTALPRHACSTVPQAQLHYIYVQANLLLPALIRLRQYSIASVMAKVFFINTFYKPVVKYCSYGNPLKHSFLHGSASNIYAKL